jgi:hypothetical protein
VRTHALMLAAIAFAALSTAAGRAEAYPQFQLVHDQTCTACHVSVDGGGLLTENGVNTADAIQQLDHNGELMYGKVNLPSWLRVGGDFRGMAGYLQTPQRYLYAFPMQADVYTAVFMKNVSLHATAGFRPAQERNEAATRLWAREHFVQYQSSPGSAEGMWIRAGHFMPVFGLRMTEHPIYTRRYGGTKLYSETYGVSGSLVTAKYEGHASAFIKNPLMDGVRQGSGGALYGEYRIAEKTLLGGGAMVEVTDWNHTYRGALTAKQYVPSKKLLLQGELQVANPRVDAYGTTQIIGYLMTSYFLTDAILVDLGLGHYDENIRVRALDRNNVDLNVHWFVTSHLELMLVTRYEVIGKGEGGPSGGWAFLQVHYRL